MFQPISQYLKKSIRKSGIENQVLASQVIDEFHRQLANKYGKKVLNKAQAKSLINGVLSVAVLNSVLANEIRLQEPEIIDNINKKIKKNLVERIRFLL